MARTMMQIVCGNGKALITIRLLEGRIENILEKYEVVFGGKYTKYLVV